MGAMEATQGVGVVGGCMCQCGGDSRTGQGHEGCPDTGVRGHKTGGVWLGLR